MGQSQHKQSNIKSVQYFTWFSTTGLEATGSRTYAKISKVTGSWPLTHTLTYADNGHMSLYIVSDWLKELNCQFDFLALSRSWSSSGPYILMVLHCFDVRRHVFSAFQVIFWTQNIEIEIQPDDLLLKGHFELCCERSSESRDGGTWRIDHQVCVSR